MAFHVPQLGRPKATKGTKRSILRESTFHLRNERKERLNIKGLSNSQFAEILLHQNIEELRARNSSCQESAAETSIDNGPSSSKISVLFINFSSNKLLEHFIDAFLHGQSGVLAVFLQLHEFLQEQVCGRRKYLLL